MLRQHINYTNQLHEWMSYHVSWFLESQFPFHVLHPKKFSPSTVEIRLNVRTVNLHVSICNSQSSIQQKSIEICTNSCNNTAPSCDDWEVDCLEESKSTWTCAKSWKKNSADISSKQKLIPLPDLDNILQSSDQSNKR